ncbi:hypothetical protein BDY19DRAFT_886849 [Irpex rosettiformis]|uniref:Uncharacterized protein n=1 Tax=Irpex rosettiformis TaxID=378272 RepID=A0ACB8U9I5_9APHY|nr:hypothetical protein BDY19DRAFT_886849 [Irpex rosettiformis]
MVLAHEDDNELDSHPYWYARVLGVFHANVRYLGEGSTSREFERVEFVWIRWFGRDQNMLGGFAARRLHCVGFVDAESGGAFGFLDPSLIIRAVHLIPAFHYGRTSELLKGYSIARQYDADPDDNDSDEDWQYYYVDMFADRDMFMRYLGGGLGHKAFKAIVSIQDTLTALGVNSAGEHDHETEMLSDNDSENGK